jgi:ectoine hydroxylase
MTTWRFNDEELERFETDGYVVRPKAFADHEVDAIVAECEVLVDSVVADSKGFRLPMGSYVFEPDLLRDVTIKWEGDSDVVHGLEPFAHLSPTLRDWAYDARFIDPMIDIIGDEQPALFTEKLNLKRREAGGPNPLHQDYPYWIEPADDAEKLATAILFLDDTTAENGCLEVVPGSHKSGVWATRTDGDFFLANEIQPPEGEVELVPLMVERGTLVFFGPYLVHQSAPNRSDGDRRALLYSYMPRDHTSMLEFTRNMLRSGTG